jgi:hypothetical protein
MSKKSTDPQGVVELPHNAWLDVEQGLVSLGIDRFILTLTVSEFREFASEIEDVLIVLEQSLTTEHDECPACGTHIEITSYTPPSDEDFN